MNMRTYIRSALVVWFYRQLSKPHQNTNQNTHIYLFDDTKQSPQSHGALGIHAYMYMYVCASSCLVILGRSGSGSRTSYFEFDFPWIIEGGICGSWECHGRAESGMVTPRRTQHHMVT
jgi:hypothetical protein